MYICLLVRYLDSDPLSAVDLTDSLPFLVFSAYPIRKFSMQFEEHLVLKLIVILSVSPNNKIVYNLFKNLVVVLGQQTDYAQICMKHLWYRRLNITAQQKWA